MRLLRLAVVSALTLTLVKVGYEVWFADHGCQATCHHNEPYGSWRGLVEALPSQ